MRTIIDNKTIKIWFQGMSTSRNINNVVEIEHVDNLMKLTDKQGKETIVNFSNVNLIEQI